MTFVAKVWKPRHAAVDGTLLCRLVLASFLLLGLFAGFVVSGRCSVASGELRPYFDDCIVRSSDSALTTESVIRTLICYFRASLAAFFLGFSSLGVICLPILFTAQGFLLSFSLFSFAEVAGQGNFLPLCAIFLLRLLFVPTCTYLLGIPAMERSWALVSLLGGGRAPSLPSGISRFALCCLCLLLGCALELWLVPLFLRTII